MDGDNRRRRDGRGNGDIPLPQYGEVATKYMDNDIQETDLDKVPDIVLYSGEDEPLPPPSYNEAVAAPSHYAPPQEPDDETSQQPDDAVGGHEDLSANEAAIVLRMQADRSSYLPENRSADEAIEMVDYQSDEYEPYPDENDGREEIQQSDQALNVEQVNTLGSMNFHSLEEARHRRPSADSDHTCTGYGPLDKPLTRLWQFLHSLSRTRLILLIAVVVFVVAFILFLGLFPASFVYVEYHEIALKQSKMTNVVDRQTVYYPGCYILGPDTRFVRFQGTAHEITEEISVFTLDTISITMKYSVKYFLRPEEVGDLYTMFMHDYVPFFQKVVKSTIRNTAAMTLTVDQFRFNRTMVERELHVKLREKLGGNCCPDCCKTQMCQSNAYCSQCKQTACDRGYHVDVRYFYMMTVGISSEVFERYLRRNVLEIEAEHEHFIQEYAIIMKQTSLLVQRHKNKAIEIVRGATAQGDQIATIAAAESEQIVQYSYAQALKGLFSSLNVTVEDHKLSLMMIRVLEEVSGNLYAGYGYSENRLFAP